VSREITLDLSLWPRQKLILETAGTEILFGGKMEGGKSYTGRILSILFCMHIKGFSATLIRTKHADIIKNHIQGFKGYRALLEPLVNEKLVSITDECVKFHQTGANINFVHCQDARQLLSAPGIESQMLFVDEAPLVDWELIEAFRTWVRMPDEMRAYIPQEWQHKLPFILYTGNPVGPSTDKFKELFIDARAPEVVEEVNGFKRQFIESRPEENFSIDMAAHRGRVANISDPRKRAALGEGNWSSWVGEYYPEFNPERHVLNYCIPPSHWTYIRSFDAGYNEPFAFMQCAISDGCDFYDIDGNAMWVPRGSLVFFDEWYGCDPERTAKGLHMNNDDIAEGIYKRTQPHARKSPILCDGVILKEMGGKTIAYAMEEKFSKLGTDGEVFILANMARIPGWSHLRDRLIGLEVGSEGFRFPTIYFTKNCKAAIKYFPLLQAHPTKREDAAEHGEPTHILDAIRFVCASYTFAKDAKESVQNKFMNSIEDINNNKYAYPSMKEIIGKDMRKFFG
jgi:hypothetical protein